MYYAINKRKKSEIEMSTNLMYSIRIIFVNYQTGKLQYNYQFYI